MAVPSQREMLTGRALRPFVVFGFGSTRESIAAEEALVSAAIPYRAMPLPPQRGDLCGIALRLEPVDEMRGAKAITTHGIVISARDEIDDY